MRTFKLAVVGGGIAGLAGAREARLAAERAGVPLEVTLFEASDRLGGKIWTEHIDRVAFEWGPDCFLAAKPRGVGLAGTSACKETSSRPALSAAAPTSG